VGRYATIESDFRQEGRLADSCVGLIGGIVVSLVSFLTLVIVSCLPCCLAPLPNGLDCINERRNE